VLRIARLRITSFSIVKEGMKRIASTGLVSGAIQGSLGVGGGILMISGLTRFAGLKHAQAVGTSLPTQIVSNFTAGAVFCSQGLVDPLAVLCIGGTSIVGSRFGARIGHNLSESSAKGAFGAILALVAPFVAFSSYQKQKTKDEENGFDNNNDDKKTRSKNVFDMSHLLQDFRDRDRSEILRMTCLGFGVGVLSAAMGIGATPVMISYLSLSGDSKGGSNDHYKTILGTAICSVCLTTSAGFAAYSTMGSSVQWKMLPILLVGSALGGVVGSNIALDVPNTALQCVFAIFCGAYGARVVQRTWLRKVL